MQIDEEELYSAVARGEAMSEEDSYKVDAANTSTFGETEDSEAGATDGNNGAAGRGAWSNAGAGVAAVKGVHRCKSPYFLQHSATFSSLHCMKSTRLQQLCAVHHPHVEMSIVSIIFTNMAGLECTNR